MSGILIPCPKCGSELRLRDRRLLGRRGRCPSCQHRFVLEEPDEVELELAEPERPPATRGAVDLSTAETPEAGLPIFAPIETPAARKRAARANVPARRPAVPEASPSPVFPAAAREAPTAAPFRVEKDPLLEALQRRKRSGRKAALAIAASLAVAAVGVVLLVKYGTGGSGSAQEDEQDEDIQVASVSGGVPRPSAVRPAAESPTNGEPISLRYLPSGSEVVLAVRPAELLGEPAGRETLEHFQPACAELWGRLTALVQYEPSKIEHAIVSLLRPPVRGDPPRVCAVVRLASASPRADVLAQLGEPQPMHEGAATYYVSDDGATAYYIADDRTFALVPNEPALVSEMLSGADEGAPPPLAAGGLLDLLSWTDSERHFTFAFNTLFMKLDGSFVAGGPSLVLLEDILDRLGEETDAAALSVHFGDELFSEIVLHSAQRRTPRALEREAREMIDVIPHHVRERVERMTPQWATRRLVGRLPAMVLAVSMAANIEAVDDHTTAVRIRLPRQAGPGLALAGYTTFREIAGAPLVAETPETPETPTSGAGVSPAMPETPEPETPEPTTVAEHLDQPISVTFMRTPLREAIAQVGESAGVEIRYEQAELQNIGVTQNVPQEFEMRDVPAREVLDRIVANLEGRDLPVAYAVSEEEGVVIFTARAAAIERGLIADDSSE